ncbi:MAG: asparagine synthase (glutamine-hydrolyzing) [Thermodesulfobacteriota bacterium]
MCGIFGLLSTKTDLDVKKFNLPFETDILRHRGPDDNGHHLDHKVFLGHRRLSIIDLNTGKQPIYNEDRTKCIIFNGEIYNFQAVREILQQRGHRFATDSDTETILHAYEEWSTECVEKLRGMFAFAIWDAPRQKLFIARDRLGIKPLFYAMWDGVFYFASEMKAILQFPEFPRVMDMDALAAYFSLSYIPAPLSIFRQIRKLEPGHFMTVEGGRLTIRKYWDLHFIPDRSRNMKKSIDGFMELLSEAVRMHMISDVPLGAFLSGGIDSGAIVALMSQVSNAPVNTTSIGFGGQVGGYLDERGYARQVAARYGTNHTEYTVVPQVSDIMQDIVRSFDEPFADHSTVPSFYLCQKTREKVTVALSGLGGDELFGGYERYLGFKLSSLYHKLPSVVRRKIIKSLIEKIPERPDGHYTVNHLKRFVRSADFAQDDRYYQFTSMLGTISAGNLFANFKTFENGLEHCREMITRYFNADNATEPLDRVFYCDIKTYLPEDILACTDRMSMRHALEARVPFLDHKLMEFCATIPSEMKIHLWRKKHILKKAMADLLPGEVISHRKQGFVGPMTQWLRTDLKEYAESVLNVQNLDKHGLFNKRIIRKILDEHFTRVEIHDKLIWSLMMFQVWYETYIENDYPVHSV